MGITFVLVERHDQAALSDDQFDTCFGFYHHLVNYAYGESASSSQDGVAIPRWQAR